MSQTLTNNIIYFIQFLHHDAVPIAGGVRISYFKRINWHTLQVIKATDNSRKIIVMLNIVRINKQCLVVIEGVCGRLGATLPRRRALKASTSSS